MPISLKSAVKSAYGDKKSKQKILNKGYVKDKRLSSANQKIFYNPDTGNLLFNVAGSRTAKDFLFSDPMLAIGKLKSKNRYKQADKTSKNHLSTNKYNSYRTFTCWNNWCWNCK